MGPFGSKTGVSLLVGGQGARSPGGNIRFVTSKVKENDIEII